MRRDELSEKQWQLLQDLLPENGKRDVQWKDYRQILDGIFWILRTGENRDGPNAVRPYLRRLELRSIRRSGGHAGILAIAIGQVVLVEYLDVPSQGIAYANH